MAVRRATRGTSSSRETAKESKGAKPVRSSFRGAAGRQQMEEEQKRAEVRREMSKNKANQPFRFWVPETQTRQIAIVDDSPDFFRYEHALKDKRSGRYDVFVPCIDEHANCGACEASDKPSYFGMYLTIIDLSPYENSDGDEVEWSKKLLVAKPAQQKKINRLYEKHGTTRGMILDMTRDGKKDAAIGNDIEFVDFMDEEELETYVTEYKDREGKVHEVIGYEPYDYDELFPDMTEEEINNLAGVSGSSTGSRSAEDRDLGRRPRRVGRGKEEEEEPAPRRAASRRAPKEEEEEEEEPPARSRRTGSAAAPARAARRAEPEEPEEEEEEEQRPARGRRGAAAEAPARGARKVREAEPEEEEEEEQRPARGRRSTAADVPFDRDEKKADPAARRAQLRGRR